MRPLTVLCLVLALCIPVQLPPAVGGGPSAREWTVTGSENFSDATLYLEDNLTVAAGGKLVLDNVTLRFNSTDASALVLEVESGGELVLRNSSLAGNGSGPYLVRARPGSRLAVSGSTVSQAGTCATVPGSAGFLVGTEESFFDNTTFRDGAAGLYLWDCSPTLTWCQFLANDAGLVLDGSNASLRRCRFSGQDGPDLRLRSGSRARALDSDTDPALVEIEDAGSSFDIHWSLAVRVDWNTGRKAQGAIVSVKPSDGPASFYQADGSGMASGIEARSSTVSSSGLQDHGPFNISVESEGRRAWNVTNISSEWELRLTLDGTLPEITIENPQEGARLNGTPLPATGSARDPFPVDDRPSVELIEGRIDDGSWFAANGTDSWSFGLGGLAEGVHTITVRARDRFGNSNQSSVSFETDLSAPSLEVWPPAGHLTAAQNITVRILTDGDTVLFNETPAAGHAPGRPLDVNWTLELEGNNTATVESRDAAGNSARTELLVVRDTTPPSVDFTSPPAFSVVDDTLVEVAGRSSDLHGIVLVEWGSDLENWTRVNGTGQWSFPAVLKQGQNTVYVRATDGAGNAGTGWLRLDLRLPDTTPPEVRILYPEAGQSVASAAMDVTVRAGDAGGIRSVQLSLDGTNWTNAIGAGDWTGRLSLRVGPNTIRARAFDMSGNANTSIVVVTYSPPPPDTAPPVLTVLYPPEGLKATYGKLVVSGRASDPSGVSHVEVSVDGKSWTRCLLTGEDWSGTVTLLPGPNTITVRAQDTQGNRAQSSTAAFFDRPADPAAERATFSLILVLVMLALLSAWLVFRAPQGAGRPQKVRRAGSEEE